MTEKTVVSAARSVIEGMGAQYISAVVDLCCKHDPNMPAKAAADMIRSGLTMEQVAAELQGIPLTEAVGPELVVTSHSGLSLAARMAEKLGIGKGETSARI